MMALAVLILALRLVRWCLEASGDGAGDGDVVPAARVVVRRGANTRASQEMLYRPRYARVDDLETSLRFVRAHSFASVVSVTMQGVPMVSHVPLTLRRGAVGREFLLEHAQPGELRDGLAPDSPRVHRLASRQIGIPLKLGGHGRNLHPAAPLYLVGHLSKSNKHWRALMGSAAQECVAIFNGPHSYVSPTWYGDPRKHVPTWNYTTVHVRGRIKLLMLDDDEAIEMLQELVQANERARLDGIRGNAKYLSSLLGRPGEAADAKPSPALKPWTMKNMKPGALEKQLRAIVFFRLEVRCVEGKFKLSQNRSAQDQVNVAAHLSGGGSGQAGVETAAAMQQFCPVLAQRPGEGEHGGTASSDDEADLSTADDHHNDDSDDPAESGEAIHEERRRAREARRQKQLRKRRT